MEFTWPIFWSIVVVCVTLDSVFCNRFNRDRDLADTKKDIIKMKLESKQKGDKNGNRR